MDAKTSEFVPEREEPPIDAEASFGIDVEFDQPRSCVPIELVISGPIEKSW